MVIYPYLFDCFLSNWFFLNKILLRWNQPQQEIYIWFDFTVNSLSLSFSLSLSLSLSLYLPLPLPLPILSFTSYPFSLRVLYLLLQEYKLTHLYNSSLLMEPRGQIVIC